MVKPREARPAYTTPPSYRARAQPSAGSPGSPGSPGEVESATHCCTVAPFPHSTCLAVWTSRPTLLLHPLNLPKHPQEAQKMLGALPRARAVRVRLPPPHQHSCSSSRRPYSSQARALYPPQHLQLPPLLPRPRAEGMASRAAWWLNAKTRGASALSDDLPKCVTDEIRKRVENFVPPHGYKYMRCEIKERNKGSSSLVWFAGA